MPDPAQRRRDAAAGQAFERWLAERLGSHVSPCHCDAVAESAWDAALASVQPERDDYSEREVWDLVQFVSQKSISLLNAIQAGEVTREEVAWSLDHYEALGKKLIRWLDRKQREADATRAGAGETSG